METGMDQASEYRKRAQKCRGLAAELWLTAVYRNHFLEMTKHWERLAVEEELRAITRAPANDPAPQEQVEDVGRCIRNVFGTGASATPPGEPASDAK